MSMRSAAHSYTGEDTVEINCHGGVFGSAESILETVLENGARAGGAGRIYEACVFKRKGWIFHRAEAVIDVITSEE